MAFGIMIRNGKNEVVIDADYSGLYVLREFNASQTFQTSAANKPSYYRFIPPRNDPTSLLAVRLDDGDKIFGGPLMFYSNRQTLTFREITTFARNAPPSSGYGFEVFNAARELCYSTARSLAPVSRILSFAGANGGSTMGDERTIGTAAVTARERWMILSPVSYGAERQPRSPTASYAYRYVGGLRRDSATQVSFIHAAISREDVGGSTPTASWTVSPQSILFFDGA
ncbi:hypothetical protein [Paracoccus chinensis]|uniref:Uncharacterized protein n=1 Tax=Paracoccus chinensis TaxID=525640 RepID=A0A1G9JIR9_9RHOB|nr:hypothetical protein [Paracoccus chinensis]SDL37388.1 hypothetical protein SAMN04487971_109153 [Paracoccus chinensis]